MIKSFFPNANFFPGAKAQEESQMKDIKKAAECLDQTNKIAKLMLIIVPTVQQSGQECITIPKAMVERLLANSEMLHTCIDGALSK